MTTTSEAPSTAPPADGADVPRHTRRKDAARWLRTHRGLVVLLVIPFLLFGLPLLFGWVFLDGDNFLQNLPMRVLVGRDLRQWTLPLWNPYLSSGTPLLGGFNAGAAYPVTWLTAVLPIFAAWTINLAVAYDVALAGMYLFLRRQSISTTGAVFGAATFAFAGYMTAQIVHIDLIEGAAWLPWTLTAVHALTAGPGHARRGAGPGGDRPSGNGRWIVLLAVSLGLSVLSGSAEAIIDSSVLVAIYTVSRLVTMGYLRPMAWRALGSTVLALGTGLVGAVALGAAQWMSGLEFLSQSQRAQSSYSFFTSGSLPVRLVALIASPFILGTKQGQPGPYAGAYNFEEVTSYVGILALIAVFSLFLKRFRSRPESRQWWIWYVIGAVGLLSAFGGQTPFGHVLYLIPGVNNERLINRNLLLVDFSLAVLVAWWVHLLFDGKSATAGPVDTGPRRGWRRGHRAEVVVPCIPLAFIVIACLFLWFGGSELDHLMGAQIYVSSVTRLRVAGLVTVMALTAAAATWIVLIERRLSARRLRVLLTTVLIVDLALFNCFVIRPPTSDSTAQALGPMSAALRAHVGDARFIIYDPDQFETSQLYALGQTDLNLYAGLASGQGYTALTDGAYYNATGAHFQEDLNPSTLAGTTWDDLNASTLLSLPNYFLTPLPRPAPGPAVANDVEFPAHINSYGFPPAPVPTSYRLAAGASRTWYFGGVLTLRSFAVPLAPGQPGDLRAGLVTPTGGIRWLPAGEGTTVGSDGHTSLEVSFPPRVQAAGLVVEPVGADGITVGTPTAVTAQTGGVALNGRMQYGVTPPHWVFAGTIGNFGVFHNTASRGWAWVRSPDGGDPASGSSATSTAPEMDGEQQVTVHATAPVMLDRSQSWSTGWRATVQPLSASPGHPAAGAARSVTVIRAGTNQGVVLTGPGDYLVTFTYFPRSVEVGLALSAAAVLVILVWAVLAVTANRRRRRRMGPAGPAPGSGPGGFGAPDPVRPAPGARSPQPPAGR